MTGLEIKNAIDSLNEEIQTLFYNQCFILKTDVMEKQKAIIKLQSQCPHEYVNGCCIYCGKEEEDGK